MKFALNKVREQSLVQLIDMEGSKLFLGSFDPPPSLVWFCHATCSSQEDRVLHDGDTTVAYQTWICEEKHNQHSKKVS